MATDGEDGNGRTLAPEEAFSLVGNETRVQILEALAEADDPLSFSVLHDLVDMRDSGQFNYHLDKLLGHFVEQGEEGYQLRQAGDRVVEAILSGAVTADPVVERTPVDESCHYCGAPIEVSFREERVAAYCTDCPGVYPDDHSPEADALPAEFGFLGYLHLPPAGVANRSPSAVHRAAKIWNISERLPAASGVCPRCSAPTATSIHLCEDHDSSEGLCPACGQRYAIGHYISCSNCQFDQGGVFSIGLLSNPDLLGFLIDHDINPIAPSDERFNAVVMDYEEELHRREPLEASFTFTADGDALTLTIADAPEIEEVVPRRELDDR